MKKYLVLLALVSSPAFSSELCTRVSDGLSSYLEDPTSRMAFRNRGGLIGGGVCWWHSRFQRSAAFLAEFAPEKAKPSIQEVKRIINTLRSMNKTVVISGYEDFNSFSRAHSKLIQSVLESWQIQDGFINQEWMRGISGKSELPSDEMKKRMNTLYSQFSKSISPVWIMAQIKGITAHSFLVLDMVPTGTGYELKLIDSNDPSESKIYTYREGERFLKYPVDTYSFVPYLGFQKDMILIKRSVEKLCGKILGIDDYLPMGDIELK